jgi:dTDP-4-amino-4,6-dideoxygalactose transaminase
VGETYHLREGIIPHSFPVLVPEESRDLLAKLLRQVGIGCTLPYSEAPIKSRSQDQTGELSERLLEIPVHQGINRRQLERAMQCLHSFEKAGREDTTSSNTNKLKAKVA